MPQKLEQLVIVLYSLYPEAQEEQAWILGAAKRKMEKIDSKKNPCQIIYIPFDASLSEEEANNLKQKIALLTKDSKILIMGKQPYYDYIGTENLARMLVYQGNIKNFASIKLWGCNLAVGTQKMLRDNFEDAFVYKFAKSMAQMFLRKNKYLCCGTIAAYLQGVHISSKGDTYLGEPKITTRQRPWAKLTWRFPLVFFSSAPTKKFSELVSEYKTDMFKTNIAAFLLPPE